MLKRHSFGFVCDPLDSFNREAETTLFWMKELDRLGHSLFTCEPKDLFLKQNEVWGRVQKISMTGHPRCFYQIHREGPKNLATLDGLFIRKDPPFDLKYLYHLYFLTRLEKKVLMINSPTGLLKHNEKLAALETPFAPKTWVTAQIDSILDKALSERKGVVVKPLNEAGGRGIYHIQGGKALGGGSFKGTLRRFAPKPLLEKLTKGETEPIVCQEYLPAVQKGDKRILLWKGKVLGQFLRRPRRGDFRANLHMGGRFEKCGLSRRDQKIIRYLAAWSKKEELLFIGFDLIGSYLTEINVTSPMGIREVNQLYGKKIEREMIRDILRML